ncbi:MAG: ABC transporter permease [Acidimicrobiia bacterium]
MTDIAADRIPGGPEVWRAHAEGHRVEQEIDESEGPISARRRFARRFFRQRAAVVGLAFLVLLVIVAVIGPWLAPYGENELTGKLLSGPTAQHWLGTDESGRDTFSRLIFATRIALSAAFSAVGIAVALGVIPGLLAGLLGCWVDYTVMRVVEAFLAFPRCCSPSPSTVRWDPGCATPCWPSASSTPPASPAWSAAPCSP